MSTFERITTERLYDDIRSAAQAAAPLFRLYGWSYGLAASPDGIPTLNELEQTITELAEHALEHFYRSEEEFRDAEVGSGRFSVRIKEFEDEVDCRIVLDLGGHTWFKA